MELKWRRASRKNKQSKTTWGHTKEEMEEKVPKIFAGPQVDWGDTRDTKWER